MRGQQKVLTYIALILPEPGLKKQMKPLHATCTNTCTPRTLTHTVPESSSAPTEQENEYKS